MYRSKTMFYAGSPYSPFFTSGLLSEPQCSSASSSRSSSPEPSSLITGLRRGSLPTDSPARSPLGSDEPSAFYFTRQPKRDSSEFRSFLSLDLAESNSLRSASLKRRRSSASKVTKRTTVTSVFPTIAEAPTQLPRPALPPTTTTTRPRHSRSRDSLRTLPSPKPAPSTSLPDLPTSQPPSPIISLTSATSKKQTIPAPRLPSLAITPGLGLSLELSSPVAVASPQKTRSITSNRVSFTSVSTRVRCYNRSHALARLEGRTASIRRKRGSLPPLKVESNFMNMMSDDEDDNSADSGISGVRLPSVIALPPARTDSFLVDLGVVPGSEVKDEKYVKPAKVALMGLEELGWEADEESESDEDEDPRVTLSTILDPEDLVFPTISMSLLAPPASALGTARSAPAAMESFPDVPPMPSLLDIRSYDRGGNKEWFPLKSFIDLQGEDELGKWSWRSFIEVANVS